MSNGPSNQKRDALREFAVWCATPGDAIVPVHIRTRAQRALDGEAVRADDERMHLAAERAGVLYAGCDTPEHLADKVIELRAALKVSKQDDPELDGTDFAHPAYWRGETAGVYGACLRIEEAMAGDIAGVCHEPLQSLRVRVATMAKSHGDAK